MADDEVAYEEKKMETDGIKSGLEYAEDIEYDPLSAPTDSMIFYEQILLQ